MLLADQVRLGDLKYTLQTAIEACIDAGHHVVADQGLGVPDTNAAAFRSLSAAGPVEGGLATRMSGAVGLRNVLVHDYAEVDDERVVNHLAHLDDLRRFVLAMTALLKDEPEPGHPPA